MAQHKTGRVSGKFALVTGAGSGLGAATATALAREGAKVAVGDVELSRAQKTAQRITEQGGTAIALHHDVTSEQSWNQAVATTKLALGGFNVLVNNAGTAAGRLILNTSLADWRHVMAINLDGVFLGVRAAIEAMRGAGGSIINISSVAALVGIDLGGTAYCASKGGVTLLTKAAALECARLKYNVRVNSVHPGYMDTPMLRDVVNRRGDPAQAVGQIEAECPMGRLGEPEDIAQAVLYLASDDSKFVTGSQLVVDGGIVAR